MRFLSLTIFLFVANTSFTQSISQTYTLSGYVTDAKSGESIFGAKVFIPSIKKGALTNNYGFYSLTVPSGKYVVEFRLSGVQTKKKEITLNSDVRYDMELGESIQDIDEIKVVANADQNTNSTQLGSHELDIDEIKTLPAFMGEVDIIKTIQLLPS